MAAPQITALPTPPSRADNPANFSALADAFLASLPTFGSEANTLAAYVEAQALSLANAETNAAASALSAAGSAAAALSDKTAVASMKGDVQALAEQVAGDSQDAQAARDSATASAAIAASYTEIAAIRMTAILVTESLSIGDGFNGVSVGPVGVADGVTVTVLPNHTWSIV